MCKHNAQKAARDASEVNLIELSNNLKDFKVKEIKPKFKTMIY